MSPRHFHRLFTLERLAFSYCGTAINDDCVHGPGGVGIRFKLQNGSGSIVETCQGELQRYSPSCDVFKTTNTSSRELDTIIRHTSYAILDLVIDLLALSGPSFGVFELAEVQRVSPSGLSFVFTVLH